MFSLSITTSTRKLTVGDKESGFPFLSVIIRHALVIASEASQYRLVCGFPSKGVGLPGVISRKQEERIEKVRDFTLEDSLGSRSCRTMFLVARDFSKLTRFGHDFLLPHKKPTVGWQEDSRYTERTGKEETGHQNSRQP